MIPLFKVHMPESVMEPLKAVLMSGYIGQGPKVDEFERALIPWIGNPNVLTVNSGTSALHLALRLAGVDSGTDVVSTPMTCAATNVPILDRGASITWADINPWTGNIDPVDVERKITPGKTKAIIAVHWGGYPCDLAELRAIATKYKVALIEDAAHAFGSTYRGRKIGTIGDYVTFSFQAIKHVTTVDGGLLVCRASDGYRRGKLLRWYGIDRDTSKADLRCEEDLVSHGYKFHMHDVGAVIGLEQLKYVSGILQRHRDNAKFYRESLEGLRDVKILRYESDRESSCWLFTLRVRDRDSFQLFMEQRGIHVSRVHVRNDLHTAFAAYRRNLPGVDEWDREQVSIPVGWWVSDLDREYIATAVKDWNRK